MIDHATMRLFQFCDSQFPTGAFSHSFGLETYIQSDKVHDGPSFKQWLKIFMNEQLTYTDGLMIKFVHEALEKNDKEELIRLDHLIYVQSLPKETRNATKNMGNRMTKLANDMYESDWIHWYNEQLKLKKVYAHPAITFTLLGHYFGADLKTIIDYYLYQNISSLTQNAVRAIPLGQTNGQKIVSEMISEMTDVRNYILKLDKDSFGLTAPGLELNQMEHENLNVRIFIS